MGRKDADLTDDSEEVGDAFDEPRGLPPCHECGPDAFCVHELVRIDLSFGEIDGDAFNELVRRPFEEVTTALVLVLQVLKSLPPKRAKEATARLSSHLKLLVEEARAEGIASEDDVGFGSRAIRDYLRGVLEEVDDLVAFTYGEDSGHPGMSSVYLVVRGKHPFESAKKAARLFSSDVATLRKLTDELKRPARAPATKRRSPTR